MAAPPRTRRSRKVDGATLRDGLRRDLPARITAALKAYAAFAGGDCPDDPKAFAAHHAACRAALAHAEMLVKLLKWAEGGEAVGAEEGDDVAALLARARAALTDDDEEEGSEDDDK